MFRRSGKGEVQRHGPEARRRYLGNFYKLAGIGLVGVGAALVMRVVDGTWDTQDSISLGWGVGSLGVILLAALLLAARLTLLALHDRRSSDR